MFDDNGRIYTFDLFRMYAGWDGGTIHDAIRYFKDQTKPWQDGFCTMLMRYVDADLLKDLESGWAREFTRARIGR
jgi:hypothetical protein